MNMQTKKTITSIGAVLGSWVILFLIVGLIMLMITMGGCATTSNKWAAASKAYEGVLVTATSLRNSGHIDDDLYNEIERVREPVGFALDQAQLLIEDGNNEQQARDWIIQAEDGLLLLAEILARNQRTPDQ